MMGHLKFNGNDYARSLESGVFDAIPKTVFAAIAVSALTSGGDSLDHATKRVVTEWSVLHSNGIVPQAVPAALRRFVDAELV